VIEPNSSNGQHPRGKQTPESDWLSLRDARNLLEVSDTTLRQWADAGHLRVYRTPGGHRRFLREDVEALTQGPPPSPEPVRADSREAPALRRIRRRLGQDSVTQQPWFQAVEPEGHDRMRLFGRRLLSLLMQEPGPRRRRQELLAEARMLGHEYGTQMLERNVALTDTVEAFILFRTMVLDSADTASWSSILEISDKVLAGVCSSYQRAAKTGVAN
jgi:excisionase family DNA binding protein